MEKATKYPRGDIASSQRLRKSPQQDGRSPLRVNGSGQIIQSSSNPNLLQVAAVRARSTLWPTELSETRAFPPKKKTIIRDQCALTASLAKRAGFCVWDAFAGGASTQPTFGLEKKRKGSTRMRGAHLTILHVLAGNSVPSRRCSESHQT